jgi:cyclic beta-1,2-glucan synthetase
MDTGILIGHFGKRDQAAKAFSQLAGKGYRRAAWVSKSADGKVRTWDPLSRRRVFGSVAGSILCGCFSALFAINLERYAPVPGEFYSILIPTVAGAIIGALLGMVWIQRAWFGVERRLIEDHRRRLVSEETVLILQAPIKRLRTALALLRQSNDTVPVIFVLHPGRENPVKEVWLSGTTPLTLAQMGDHARRMAVEHRLYPKPLRDTHLLSQIERSRQWVQQACLELSEAIRLEQNLPMTAEWLLDNEYIFESNARDVRLNLPRKYYRQLPALASGPDQGLPRIYGLARELAVHSDLRLDEENILAFIEAYQTVQPLSIGELWAVPQMLRAVLIESIRQLAAKALAELREGEVAAYWANRMITANRRDPNQLFSILAELTETLLDPSPYFASQLIDCLYDEGAALTPVRSWLERILQRSMSDLDQREKKRQANNQISIGNAFTSLRQLALLDWKECFERLSRVEQLLRRDPAGIYPRMDFATRDRYRRAIEELRHGSGLAEEQIAQHVIDLADQAGRDSDADERLLLVGAYLIGDKREELARLIQCRETLRFRILRWAFRRHSFLYFFGLAFFSGTFMAAALLLGLAATSPAIQSMLLLLLLVPASQLALEVLNYLVVRFFPPRPLPKMDFRDAGILDACRTLVVVPMLLTDPDTIRREAEKIEIRYLANQEANLLFGLYSDYKDAAQAHCEADEELLQVAKQCIEALNQRHGRACFFLFHRERKWSESEQAFIGWERKRGKLEELNDLIVGTRPPDAGRLVHVGDPDQLGNVRFVITLDSDTQLPHDTGRRLIETLAHPLNQPRFDKTGRVRSGYTIIQPRVSPSLPSASGSPFSRLFSDPIGIDPYTHAVSDVYQDLAGEGSYHGKGIYDVRAFSRVLSGRFPDARLLSHDLIEGAHVRVGLASDIELYDEFPQDYPTYSKRQHRWIRGDWQIIDWILPRVPLADGRSGPNPLSWFDRWKILDNLRRSLLPAFSLVFLMVAWLSSSRAGWIAGLFVAGQLLFHSLAQPVTWATTGRKRKGISPAKAGHDVLRVIVEAALLPYQAWQALDAVTRVLYRRHISHRKLLEWTSAQAMYGRARSGMPLLVLMMSLVSLFSLGAGWFIFYRQPTSFWLVGPWLLLWFLSPLIGWLLSRRPSIKQPQFLLAAEDRQFLRIVARRTWRYFADFVNAETSWLPPDNYQVSFRNQLALRTSPTNIGLWMTSVLGAHACGYVTVDEVTDKLSGTMATLNSLERYEGHLLNWYDIKTLTPLNPRYVSFVDSGNLLAGLWVLDQGLEALSRAPLLDGRALAGLCDTGKILKEVVQAERNPDIDGSDLDDLLHAWESPPERVTDLLAVLRQAEPRVREWAEKAARSGPERADAAYWAGQMQQQLAAWLSSADRYLVWVTILAEKTEEEITALDPEVILDWHLALRQAPSLQDLARGPIACIASLWALREKIATQEAGLEWIDRILEAFSRAKWLAGEMLALSDRLRQSGQELSASINMRFLYSIKRRIFSIGFNVSEARLDRAFYDLLASEARLGSFIAIARGDVPVEHWFAMGRPYGAVGRRRVLLSWTGTMFEYLMPFLFQRSYGHSLLDKAAREAVAIQISYGRKHRVAWGVSESAFGDLDLNKTYQYHAFGVPELGLKRGLADKIVIAPYAAMLAVSMAPAETVSNLKRLAALGLLSDYGYYEALDYSRQSERAGEHGTIVYAYMAHHQAMSFLALTNFLHANVLQQYFHADPRVATNEPLLHERILRLPPLHHIATRERVSSVAAVGEAAPAVSRFDTPHTSTPKTHLISNGRYALMLTNAGGGYSRFGDFDITRWRSDRTRDDWGIFCYIHDVDSGRLWCNSYHPTAVKVEHYNAHFALDRVVFRRVDHEFESETEVIGAPEDDVEIRRLTLINRSNLVRRLDLTSYIELALAPHNADCQHPAFNKLFIQTEALSEQRALLAFRRPRSSKESPIYVAHRWTLEQAEQDTLRFETDRRRFIGRGRTLADPMGATQEPGNTQGFVLDPILSLRCSLSLVPGERVRVSLILAAGEAREQVCGLMSKYGDPHAIDRAMDAAWTASQLELRLLRIQPDEALRFQQLAGHLLYPDPGLRAAAKCLTENRKGQAGLWAYTLSGDLPIALVAIGESRDLGLVRQMLQAHTYWRRHGLTIDLVILNEEIGGYTQPLREELDHLIRAQAVHTGMDRPGGVHLRNAELIPAEDLTLLQSAASVVMVAARGGLAQQLAAVLEAPHLAKPLTGKRDPRDPSAALPFMELPFFNSLGGFTPDGREYAIYLGPGMHTPAPWVNVIANSTFGTLVSETGAGFTWQGNSQRNRLTQWSNDPVMDPPAEALYIRDEETGLFWTPTAAPIREDTAYRARHGAGYSVFEHNSHGIEQELTVFVPVDDQGGDPIKLQRLVLRNDSSRPRRLSLTYYVDWTLSEAREAAQMHVTTEWDDEVQALLARNCYQPDFADRVAFAAVSAATVSYTADRTEFIGRNRSLDNPAAMEHIGLSRRTGAGLDPCAALQTIVNLAAGEQTAITGMLGQALSLAQVHALVATYSDGPTLEKALRQTQAWWDNRLGALEVHTPELAADFLINRWLLYQTLSCRLWARSGFYQSGGAFGFRDQLQDVLALLYADPESARKHILLAAGRQFKEGDVQHWWHQPGGSGIRSRISDDLLWLPYAVSQYIRVTADVNILREKIPFLEAPLLNADQQESFQTPAISAERVGLFEHCRRALLHSQRFGDHGLPLMGTGDWNDGMNLVGAKGKGESVWLAWFMVDVLQAMAEMSEQLGLLDQSRSYAQDRETLIRRIEESAWDGAWYCRAFFDDGAVMGSAANAEARIDSLPQSWALLSGGGDPKRAAQALESAWNRLVREDQGIVLLFEPPFDQADPSPGYIRGYPPGVRENGGQYTHAALWLAMALARKGEGTRAAQILRLLNPIEHTREPEAVWRYGVEPYVVAADVYALAGHIGQGGWSWYTGSAAWMYRTWIEEVLGLKKRGETLQISPVIPAWWDGFTMTYRHGESLYEITVENPDHREQGVAWVEMDGQRLENGVIRLGRDLIKHRVLVRMGEPLV